MKDLIFREERLIFIAIVQTLHSSITRKFEHFLKNHDYRFKNLIVIRNASPLDAQVISTIDLGSLELHLVPRE
jgi:hypothetical protein